mgnify:CR=1 FL=1
MHHERYFEEHPVVIGRYGAGEPGDTESDPVCRGKQVRPCGTGEDAEQVLDGLKTLISTYGNATAADLYELAGTHDFKHEMTRIGWTSVDGAEIVQTDDGYIITLPQPKPITYKEEP